MRLLLPTPSDILDLEQLYPHAEGLVRANMVCSLDGAAQDSGGKSDGLSSPADKRLFGVLRSLADVVLVGASTVRKEGYGPAKVNAERQGARTSRGQLAVPPIAVVSKSLKLDLGSAFFTAAEAQPIVVTVESAPAQSLTRVRAVADVIVAGEDKVDIPVVLDALCQRGLSRVLCEGGPHLLGDVAAAGRLDELCLTLALSLVGGDAGRILTAPPIENWRGEIAHVVAEGGHLFLRVVRQ